MRELIIVIDVLAAIGLVALVLLQQGKGADMGAAFGSGASQTLFGSRGTANFLTRTTAILAVVFFVLSLVFVYRSFYGMRIVSGGGTSSLSSDVAVKTA